MDDQVHFSTFITPYYNELLRYCRMITGSPWDGDDLFQDTWMKALQASTTLVHHSSPKAYLFRVATNAWIDLCRKRKFPVDTYEDKQMTSPGQEVDFEIHEAVEVLVHRLPPRQVALVLLMEVFGFDAKSVAAMMETTEGAAKTGLYRARQTLKNLKDKESLEQSRLQSKSTKELVNMFLNAFKLHNPVEVLRIYRWLQSQGVEVTRVAAGKTLLFQFRDPDGNVLVMSVVA